MDDLSIQYTRSFGGWQEEPDEEEDLQFIVERKPGKYHDVSMCNQDKIQTSTSLKSWGGGAWYVKLVC